MKIELKNPVNLGRHAAVCKICTHTQREEIERAFINWESPAAITKQYGLRNRASVYRHAHALGLFPKRQGNVEAALRHGFNDSAPGLGSCGHDHLASYLHGPGDRGAEMVAPEA